MNKTEQRFLTLVRSNRMQSFYAAQRILNVISTPVLFTAANELIHRARYLYFIDNPYQANYANQFACRISEVLHSRNQDVRQLDTNIEENIQMF